MKDAPFDKRDAGYFVMGLGMGLSMTPSTEAITSSLPREQQGVASALNDVAREFGSALGVALLGAVTPRNKYTAIRDDKPKSNDEAKRPEFKVCKFATAAIVTEGSDVGTIHKVCTNPACPVHHPKKANSASANDAQFKAEQEKRRREEAIANATGLRVLSAIGAAVPVRLMKRDLPEFLLLRFR